MQFDLFNTGKTKKEQLTLLKKDIKRYNNIIKPIKLLYGEIDSKYLIITNLTNKFFTSEKDKYLINKLNTLNISYSYTYSYININVDIKKITIKDIKNYSIFVKKLTDIINPLKIVCLGESSVFSFFRKKFILDDYHGKIIGEYNNIPIFLTYSSEYYLEFSKLENKEFKDSLFKQDWNNIIC